MDGEFFCSDFFFLIFVVVKDLPKRAGQNMSFMESATEKKKNK